MLYDIRMRTIYHNGLLLQRVLLWPMEKYTNCQKTHRLDFLKNWKRAEKYAHKYVLATNHLISRAHFTFKHAAIIIKRNGCSNESNKSAD